MIIRIFRGHVPADRGDEFLTWARDVTIPYVTRSSGLQDLLVGSRREGDDVHVIVATAWTDLDAELRALGGVGPRAPALSLPDWVVADAAEHFEAIGTVLPPLAQPHGSRVRLLRLALRPNVSSAFFDYVRGQQEALRASGDLVAALMGRRIVGSRDEYASVALWRDDTALETATGGAPDRPVGWHDLETWAESYSTHLFDTVAATLARS